MQNSVSVAVAARLHLGFLDLHGGLGRRFGGLGLALDEPKTILNLRHGDANSAEGPQAERALHYLRLLTTTLGLASGHSLVIREAIPAHAGLGSGTQLALAVAAALRRLHGLDPDLEADALRMERTARSGLGTGFFVNGGLALDGGRKEGGPPAPIVARLPFPAEWRVLLVLDPGRQGVHGAEEIRAFASLPPFPADLAAHLCRVAIMQTLPAIAERDLSGFSRAITEIQRLVGDHFSPVQGGRFFSPDVAAVLDLLAREGVEGHGQSSWGPTGFAFFASQVEARLKCDIASPLASRSGLELRIVKGRNTGATVTASPCGAHQGGPDG
jgi:beta-ribofuranosylaminobenzene 5'-phosphate synthase